MISTVRNRVCAKSSPVTRPRPVKMRREVRLLLARVAVAPESEKLTAEHILELVDGLQRATFSSTQATALVRTMEALVQPLATTKTVENVKDKVAALKSSMASLNDNITDLQDQMTDLQTSFETEVTAVNINLVDIHKRIGILTWLAVVGVLVGMASTVVGGSSFVQIAANFFLSILAKKPYWGM